MALGRISGKEVPMTGLRTFKDVHGGNLIEHPFIQFPPRHLGKADAPPKGWIATHDLSKQLGCSPASVRQTLHNRYARYVHVRKKGLYWHHEDVGRFLDEYVPEAKRIPAGFVGITDACRLLGTVRSYIYRLAKTGRVQEFKCRMRTARGCRLRCFYKRSDLERILSAKAEMERRGNEIPLH